MSNPLAENSDNPGTDSGNSLAGNATAIALTALLYTSSTAALNFLRPAPPQSRSTGYELTRALSPPLLWTVIIVSVLSISVGWLTRRKWPVALGMILPFPIAMLFEVVRDPTSHNLMPFEILLFWVPILLVASLGAALGRRLRSTTE